MDSIVRWLAITGGMAIICLVIYLAYGYRFSYPGLKCTAFILTFIFINAFVPAANDQSLLRDATDNLERSTGMRLTVSATWDGNTSVGNEWSQYFSVNGFRFGSGKTYDVVLYPDQTLTAASRIVERDTNDDVGVEITKRKLTYEDLRYGFAIRQTVEVKESSGRYSGSGSKWTVVYSFTP